MDNKYGSFTMNDARRIKTQEPLPPWNPTKPIHSPSADSMSYFIMDYREDMMRFYNEHGIEWMNKMFIVGYEWYPKSICKIIYDNETDELVVIPIYVNRVITTLTERIETLERRVTELSNQILVRRK